MLYLAYIENGFFQGFFRMDKKYFVSKKNIRKFSVDSEKKSQFLGPEAFFRS
jgi:hypothetical protein